MRVWHLGGRKIQKGGFVSILGTIARPFLVSVAGAIGGEVLKGIGNKIFGGKSVVKREERKDIDMLRNNILFRRVPNPRHVQVPNGRVFFAKYKRVNRHGLALTQVRIARTCVRKIGPRRQRIRRFDPRNKRTRRQQAATGLDLAMTIELVRRAAGSRLGKMMINDAIDTIPTAY